MFTFKSQKQRLVFWFLSISIVPLLVTFAIAYFNQKEQIRMQEIEKLTAIRDLKVREINNWLNQIVNDINILSKNTRLIELEEILESNKTQEEIKIKMDYALKVFHRYQRGYNYVKEAFLISTTDGKVVLSTNEQFIGEFVASELYYKNSIENKQVYIKDIYLDNVSGKPEMLLAAPVFDTQQKSVIAVVAIKVNLQPSLYKLMLSRTGLGETGETLIVNKDVFALNELRWYDNAPLNLKISAAPAVKSSQGITGIERTKDYRGEEIYAAYTHIDKINWGFVAKRDVKELDLAIEDLTYNFLLTLIITIILLYAVARLIAQSISKPIVSISSVTNEFKNGNYGARIKVNTGDEIGFLANSINSMIDEINLQKKTQNGREKVVDALISVNDFKSFWLNLSQALMNISQANTCACYALDENDNLFKPQYNIGVNSELLIEFSYSTLEGEFGEVIKNKKTVVQNHLTKGSITRIRTTVADYLPKEIVTHPIVINNKVIGIVSLSKNNKFKPGFLEILSQSEVVINSTYSNILETSKTQLLAKELSISYKNLSTEQTKTEEQNERLKQQSSELKAQAQELQNQNIELETQSRQVEEANRMKSEFLSNMSHELRTPLNSVMALSRVLLMNAKEKLSNDEISYLEIIERNGINLLQMINSILDLSKIEAGKIELSISKFNINKTIQHITENISPLADDKGLEIIFNLDESIPEIESDDSKTIQILHNIIGNAIKFTEQGTITISTKHEHNHVKISVKDTGIGIQESALASIFDEFKQEDGSISRKYEGSGLGLAIAKKTTQLLKGSISVQSKINQGSEFIISLPISWDLVKPAKVSLKPSQPLFISEKSILIVDDEPQITRMISENLQKAGYNTYEVNSGKEALELAAKIKPFAITLDLIMPEMDGYEVMQELKKDPETENIPIIIVSMSKNKETALALGALGYISKPILKDELIKEIKKISTEPLNILVVDDNEFERKKVSKFLLEENYQIIEAKDGINCLDILQLQKPDVIILDLIMPGLDGFKVIEHLKNSENTSNIPVIISTAKDLTKKEKELLASKSFSVLSKNYSPINNTLQLIKQELVKIEDRVIQADEKKGKRILIVEDNEAAIIQIKAVLENQGFKINIAKGGQQAIDFVKHTVPDGIILDLMMPEVDGFQVLETIRSTEKTRLIPVLILTAKNLTKEDLKKLSSDNVQQLIQKGDVNRDELIKKVKLMLGEKDEVKDKKPEVKKSKKTKREQHAKYKIEKSSDKNSTKILVIEDNADNMTTITAILKSRYNLILANNGMLGIEVAEKETPGLILLDMMLPEMSGIEVVKILKNNKTTNHIPVIALTARAMKGDREEILEAGCDDYMSKPIDPLALLELTEKWTNL